MEKLEFKLTLTLENAPKTKKERMDLELQIIDTLFWANGNQHEDHVLYPDNVKFVNVVPAG